MASGRQVEYQLRLNSNAVSVLGQADQAANKFDNSMWQVQKTLASFGLGLGAHFLIDAAKGWTQAAADYEQAMLRIKNASKEEFGILNQDFVTSQVDHFKLKLQETADAYGSFLFKIKNAGLTNEVQNRLFENLNVVGKVAAIPQEQMDATVRNLGIMLGEGVLEARHLRQLSYVHPQIVPYLAEALGLKSGQIDQFNAILHGETTDESAMQKLSLLISSGKLTKLAINSHVLIDAFEKYRESLETKLPETLHTVQSELNDLSNTWLRFKNNLVLGEKPELISFFNSLKNGIHWLSEHEEQIISISRSIIHLIEAYAVWKAFLFTLEAPLAIFGFFRKEIFNLNSILSTYSSILGKTTEEEIAFASASASATSANYAEAESIYAKTAAYQAYQEGFWVSQQKMLVGGFPLLGEGQRRIGQGSSSWNVVNPGVSSSASTSAAITDAEVIAESTGKTAGILESLTFAEGALVVGIAAASIYELSKVLQEYNRTNRQETLDFNQRMAQLMLDGMKEKDDDYSGKINRNYDETPAKYYIRTLDQIDAILNKTGITSIAGNEFHNSFIDLLGQWGENKKYVDPFFHPNLNTKINTPPLKDSSHLRGNSSNYFSVHIQTMNGVNKLEIKEASKDEINDIKNEIGVEIDRMMLEVINDIQMVKSNY